MTNITISTEQDNIDTEALIEAIVELGEQDREAAENIAYEIIAGHGAYMKTKNPKDASRIIKLLGDAGVKISSAHEKRNS